MFLHPYKTHTFSNFATSLRIRLSSRSNSIACEQFCVVHCFSAMTHIWENKTHTGKYSQLVAQSTIHQQTRKNHNNNKCCTYRSITVTLNQTLTLTKQSIW